MKYDMKHFSRWGNLLFYKNGINVKPNDRFFFFNTLLSDYAKNDYQPYTVYANRLGAAAKEALTNNPFEKSSSIEENSRFIELLNQAENILITGIAYERQNEEKYIQDKLNKFQKAFKNSSSKNLLEVEKINSLIQQIEDGFDYKQFIALINILTQGLANSAAIFEHEKKHITDVNERFLTARQKHFDQVDGLDRATNREHQITTERLTKREKKFNRSAEKIYLEHHTFNIEKPTTNIGKHLRLAMSGTETIDVIMGKKITEQLNTIFDNPTLVQEIIQVLETNGIVDSYKDTQEVIKGKIISTIVHYMDSNLANILKSEVDYTGIANNIDSYFQENDTTSFTAKIRGVYSNFGQYGHRLKFFQDSQASMSKSTLSAEGLYDALVDFKKELKSVKRVKDLTEEQKVLRRGLKLQQKNNKYDRYLKFIAELEKYADEIKKGQKTLEEFNIILEDDDEDTPITLSYTSGAGKGKKSSASGLRIVGGKIEEAQIMKELGFKQFQAKNLDTAIATIKTRVSEQIKEDLVEMLISANLQGLQSQVENQVRTALESLKISIGGPTYSEFRTTIQNNIDSAAFWSGKLNIKNDSIIITATSGKPVTHFKLSNQDITEISTAVSSKVLQLKKQYEADIMDAVEQDMREISKSKQYTNYDRLAANFFEQANIYNDYINKAKNEINEIENQLKALDTSNEDEIQTLKEELEIQQEFLNELENTLYISNTVKTFNNYQDQIGFVGGSIGSNIINQINSLNTIFSKAGMELTQEEINWLIFACINNSSLSVVGHQNENKIEAILGSLAAFTLFDEGGAEVEILNSKLNDSIQKISAPNIMHLYLLNGIYYPGSFVLQTVLNNLQVIKSEIENNVKAIDSNHYSNVKITSNMNYSKIPNNKKDLTWEEIDQHPWETVSASAVASTNIRVVFLAGLLSVINGLMEAVGNIELPS